MLDFEWRKPKKYTRQFGFINKVGNNSRPPQRDLKN